MPAKTKLFFYAAGIFSCYFYFGILQERITRTKYGPQNEMFNCTLTLVLIQCIVNTVFAKSMLMTFMKQGIDSTRSIYYAICSLTYLTAMVSSNMALQHISYPTQVVGKSCKPIPIMSLGVILGGKRYPKLKYLFVSLIVLGVALFMWKGGKGGETSSNLSASRILSMVGFGEILLLVSLTMDGLTGAVQERMKSEHQTKSVFMMYKINLWSTFYLMAATIITGELPKFIDFVHKYPNMVNDITLFATLSAVGQVSDSQNQFNNH